MRESKTVEVDGVSYLINPMGLLKANRIMVRLVKLLGSPVANFLMQLVKGDTKKDKKSLLDMDLNDIVTNNIDKMVDAVMELTSKLDEEEVDIMIKDLLGSKFVIPDGKQYLNIESHFGAYGLVHLYKVMFEVLKVNFRDFLDALGGKDV